MKKIYILLLAVFLFTGKAAFSQEDRVYPSWAILNATYAGDIDLMISILEVNPDRDVRDAFGGTALHIAIFQNNLQVIRFLLDNGFDINARATSNGYTPLHYCVWTNNLDAARLLISYNADKNIRCNEGFTPVERATREAKRDMILLLMR